MERDGLGAGFRQRIVRILRLLQAALLTSIVLVPAAPDKPSVRLNITLDAGIAEYITSESKRRGMSRKNYLERIVRHTAQVGG